MAEERKQKLSFDPECLKLVRYFYPDICESDADDCAQQLQDVIESFSLAE